MAVFSIPGIVRHGELSLMSSIVTSTAETTGPADQSDGQASAVEQTEIVSPQDQAPESGTLVVRPDASQLVDRTPEWFRMSRQTVVWTLILGLLWLFFSYQPVWHTDIWGHLYYGRLIVEQGSIPETEPVLPLATGVPFRDTAWLSQVLGYGLYLWQGVTALRFAYAALMLTCVLALVVRFQERTSSLALCLIGLAIFLVATWKSLHIVRPQLAGLACYLVLLSLLTARRWPRWIWGVVPALFVLWTNLHGSFPLGLLLLGTLLVGRAADVGLRTGRWRPIFRDRRVRGLFLLLELAMIAVLINPYGLGIFAAVQSISQNPNIRQLVEWDPITLHMMHGKGFAVVSILLMLMYRFSPRRISVAEVLLLLGLGLSSLWTVRMMVWWTPVAAWCFVLHASPVMRKFQRQLEAWRERRSQQLKASGQGNATENEPGDEPAEIALIRPRSGLNSIVVLGMIWIFFAYTPFGATMLHGYPEDNAKFTKLFKQNVSHLTPVDLTVYLRAHPPHGLTLSTFVWSDYLLWAGPPGISLYLNSHAHLLPEEVWEDYFVMTQGRPGWDDKLDRYGINTIVLDHQHRTPWIEVLKRHPAWEVDYEDQLGVILKRREPVVHY